MWSCLTTSIAQMFLLVAPRDRLNDHAGNELSVGRNTIVNRLPSLRSFLSICSVILLLDSALAHDVS